MSGKGVARSVRDEDARFTAEVVLKVATGGQCSDHDERRIAGTGWGKLVMNNLESFFHDAQLYDLSTAECDYLIHVGVEEIAKGLTCAQRHDKMAGTTCWLLFDSVAHQGRSDGWYGVFGNIVAAGLFLSQFEERDPYFEIVWRGVEALASDNAAVVHSAEEVRTLLEATFARLVA